MDGLWEQARHRLALFNSVKKGFPLMLAGLSLESALVGDLGHQIHQKRTLFEVGVGQPLVVLVPHDFAAVKTLVHMHAQEFHLEKLQKIDGRKTRTRCVWVTALLDVRLEVSDFNRVQLPPPAALERA